MTFPGGNQRNEEEKEVVSRGCYVTFVRMTSP